MIRDLFYEGTLFVEYPKWKYHKTKEAFIVKSKDEESKLGKDWVDSPAHVDMKESAKTKAAKAESNKSAAKADGNKS